MVEIASDVVVGKTTENIEAVEDVKGLKNKAGEAVDAGMYGLDKNGAAWATFPGIFGNGLEMFGN